MLPQLIGRSTTLVAFVLIVLMLDLSSCSRGSSTRPIHAQHKYQLPPDSPKGEIAIDSSYALSVQNIAGEYFIRYLVRVDTASQAIDRASYQLVISVDPDTAILQSFSERVLDDLTMSKDNLVFVDANFDGFPDIQVITGWSANGQNTSYQFYMFDPDRRRFVRDTSFSERFGENTSIDVKTKEITTGATTGCAGQCYEFNKYRLVNGDFVLVERNVCEQDEASLKFITTKEILKDGRLVVVERDTTQ